MKYQKQNNKRNAERETTFRSKRPWTDIDNYMRYDHVIPITLKKHKYNVGTGSLKPQSNQICNQTTPPQVNLITKVTRQRGSSIWKLTPSSLFSEICYNDIASANLPSRLRSADRYEGPRCGCQYTAGGWPARPVERSSMYGTSRIIYDGFQVQFRRKL